MSRLRIVLPLCLLAAWLVAGCGDDDRPDTLPDTLTVMTYNVYLGADTGALFQKLIAGAPLQGLLSDVGALYQQATDKVAFSRRAGAIAESIAAHEPHFVGLQEMALIRRDRSNFHLVQTPDAETEVVDYREVLMDRLEAAGMNYTIAAEVQNMDIELPMCRVELQTCPSDPTTIQDARLTLFDVLLVRDDVEVSAETQENYAVFVGPPAVPLAVQRGYVAVNATVANRTYRVVSTHLEAFNPPIRNAQAAELIGVLEMEDLPVILLGDFNSSPAIEPGAGIDDRATYSAVIDAGFADMWKGRAGTGYTCCQAPDLSGEGSLSKRIDFVFARNSSSPSAAFIDTAADDAFTVGDQPADRALDSDGALIWPSDHAGVGAVLYVD